MQRAAGDSGGEARKIGRDRVLDAAPRDLAGEEQAGIRFPLTLPQHCRPGRFVEGCDGFLDGDQAFVDGVGLEESRFALGAGSKPVERDEDHGQVISEHIWEFGAAVASLRHQCVEADPRTAIGRERCKWHGIPSRHHAPALSVRAPQVYRESDGPQGNFSLTPRC